MIDPLVVAELELAFYERWVEDEIAVQTLERVTGEGGGWGSDSALFGELLKMRASFAAFPVCDAARRLADPGTDGV